MKGSKSLIAIATATTVAITPSAIAAPKTSLKAAGRVTTSVVNTILSGAGIPAKTIGIDGDFYIDTKNANLYGPKTKGVWKIATSLKQADSKTVSTITGDTGPAGPAGPQGEKGEKGDKGATGEKGLTGDKGATGATGATGLTGATGAKGNDGAIGLTGAAGATGATGATGSVGATGAKGDTGTAGATGAAGSNGTNGLNGNDGAIGPKGDTGATGSQGSQGPAGPTGPKGDTGETGAAGISNTKFLAIPNISLATSIEGNSTTKVFFTADSDGNYTFDILVGALVATSTEFKFNAEIVSGSTAITSQYAIAYDSITNANGMSGRQYGFHVFGIASNVIANSTYGLRISIQWAAGSGSVIFSGRALINKVGSIG